MSRMGLESEAEYWDDLAARLQEVIERFRAPMSSEAELKSLGSVIASLEAAESRSDGVDHMTGRCASEALPFVAIEYSTMSAKQAVKQNRRRISLESEPARKARHALTAEITLFGRSLVEAGKKALPVEAVMAAHQAKQAKTIGEFITATEAARQAMSFDRWEERHQLLAEMESEELEEFEGGGEEKAMSAMMVLPHVFGCYPDSPMRPNCLGAAILVASWCELAGLDNYLYASLVQSGTEYHYMRMSQMWRRIRAFLSARNIEANQYDSYCMDAEIDFSEKITCNQVGHSSLNPHACVAFNYSHDYWMVMDNWLNKHGDLDSADCAPGEMYGLSMKDAVDALLRHWHEPAITVSRRAWSLDAGWKLLEDELDDTFMLTEVLLQAYESYVPRDESDSLESYLWHLVNSVRGTTYGRLHFWRCGEEKSSSGRIAKEDPLGWVMYSALMHNLVYRYRLAQGVKAEDLEEFTESLYASYQHDAHTAARIRYDLVLQPLREVSSQIAMQHSVMLSPEYNSHEVEQPVLEFGFASIQFGCAALAHLITWDDWAAARLRLADLLHFTTSQAIAYDAITDLHHEASNNRIQVPELRDNISISTVSEELPFVKWLMQGGRDDNDMVVFPGDIQLVGPQATAILRAWRYLQGMPPALRHRQASELLVRIQQLAAQQPISEPVLVPH